MMIQFTTGQGGMLDAFRDPHKVRRPVSRRTRIARAVAVIVVVAVLAVFAGLVGHTVRTSHDATRPAQITAARAASAGPLSAEEAGRGISSGVFADRHLA